ncbi:MAG: signal peptidase I [Lachnospiraceae bacterium]
MTDQPVVEEQKEEPKTDWAKEIRGWIIYFATLFAVLFVIINYVGQLVQVDGISMVDNLHDDDKLIIDKLSYRFHEPERFDIVVFPSPISEGERYIKRIIGLPGETVQIDNNGRIWIDGEVLEEDYGYEVIEDPGMAVNPITLGEDEYWCMGDNRNVSLDSREIGPVQGDKFMGRAFVRVWPLQDIGLLSHE